MPLQFNTAYYLQQNPDVAAALDSGAIPSAQWHFENFGAAEGRDPNANFDVSYYLSANPDVAAAFENGVINPFDHFLRFGASENRAPSANLEPIAAGFDEEAYLDANPDVAAAVQSGVFADGYQHWVIYGRYEDSRPEATFNGGTPVSDVADTIDATELTSALNTLSDAQQAVTDFLAGLTLDTDFDGTVDVQAGAATQANVDTALTNALTQINAETTVDDLSADRSDAFNQAIITEQKSVNTQALNTAQQAVNNTTGLSKAITQLESAQTNYQTAVTAQTAASTELDGELAKFNTVNDSGNSAGGVLQVVADLAGLSVGAAVVTDSASDGGANNDGVNNIIVVGANGQLTAAEGVNPSTYQGFSALLQDAQAAYSAQSTLTNATSSFESAISNVITTDGGTVGTITDYYDATTGELSSTFDDQATDTAALLDARETVTNFNEAVENYNSAKATSDQLATLNEDVTEARAAIEDSKADGGLGVTLLEGTDSFTSESDVYLYNEDDSAGVTLNAFGDAGQDRIFFGDGYKFVQIPDGSQITSNVGDSSALEIFWQQSGSDLKLYVEDQTFAGNGSSASDVTEITLTGVNADDVNFANGYLSADQVA